MPLDQTLYLIVGFYVASAVGQPVLGNLADRWAPSSMFVGGLLLVVAAGTVGGLGTDIATLTVARVLLALGTASAYSSGIVMTRARYAPDTGRVFRALSTIAATQQLAASLAPPLGGALIGAVGWRFAFLVNIPLAVTALVLAVAAIRRGSFPRARAAAADGSRALDLLGSGLFASTVVGVFLATADTRVPAWAAGGTTLVLLIAFVAWERRTAAPLVDVRALAAQPAVAWIFARFVLVGTICYAQLLLWPQWLQQGRGLSATFAGLLLLPTSAVAPVAAIAARGLGHRTCLVVAHVCLLGGSAALLLLQDASSGWLLVLVAAVFGIPIGLLHQSNQAALFEQVSPDRTGSTVGLLRSMWYLGAISASTLGGVYFDDRASTAALHGLATTLTAVAALVVGVDVVGGRGLRRHPRRAAVGDRAGARE